jgi:hypothetical protein
MATKTRENPYGIDPARDLHHSPPRIDVPNWSENLLFSGADSGNGIFFYHHLGLVGGAPDVWRGDFAVALPDGRQLLQVTFGNSESANNIGDGTLECECIEPLRSWRIRFKGAAYLTDAETNRNNYLSVEQIPVACEWDIRWEATSPMHEAAKNDTLSSGFAVRYEQAGQYWGTLRFGDEVIALDGHGYRDHSVGPRDYSRFSGHAWTWGAFPSGKMFGSLSLYEPGRPGFAAPWVTIDGELKEAELVSGPHWDDTMDDFDEKTFDVVLRVDGVEHTIRGENMGYGYYWTLFNPSQLCFGRVPSRMVSERQWVCRELVTRWTWDGEEVLGLTEISRRLGT